MFIKQKELLSLWRMICRFWFHMRTWSGIGRMRKPWGPPLRLVSSHPPEIDPPLPLLGLLANVLRSFVHWFCVSKTECCRLTVWVEVLVLWWQDKLVSAGMIHPGFIHIILLIRWSQWYMILNLCCFVQAQICDYELIFFEPAMLNFFLNFSW